MIRRFLRLTTYSLFLLPLMVGVAWWWRAPLLTGIANQWIVSDAPVEADAIVVLGGGLDSRPAAAARLYREGWAKQVLVLQPERTMAAERGLVLDSGTITRKILVSEHVPETAITLADQAVTSTIDEARVVATWAREHNAHRLLVPTDIFHTRRARWIFRQLLDQDVVEVRMIPVNPRRYTSDDWWQNEEGLISFQNEVLKYILYRIRF